MNTVSPRDSVRASPADRLGELASIGAGHAAGALATLLQSPFEMRVPRVRRLAPGAAAAPLAGALGADEAQWSAVLFDVSGGPGGVLALLLAPTDRDALLEALLDGKSSAAEQAESALREVGNIVASHALSAVGDLLGTSVLPSPPELALRSGPRAFAQRVAARERAALRIEVELFDRAGRLRALLAWAPDEGG